MTKYSTRLPQCVGDIFLTDGGLTTTLILHDGLDLPDFADLGYDNDSCNLGPYERSRFTHVSCLAGRLPQFASTVSVGYALH